GREHILDAEREPLERPRITCGQTRIGCLRHGACPIRCLQHISIERARLFHGGQVRLGELDGRELSSAKAVACGGKGQRREIGHCPDRRDPRVALRARPRMVERRCGEPHLHSTTFGTTKKCSSAAGAFLRMASAMPPSVTTSGRFFISIGMTEVIGSTPSTSTSDNCSTKARMALSSPRSCSISCSATATRASCAMRRTVSGSTDMGLSWADQARRPLIAEPLLRRQPCASNYCADERKGRYSCHGCPEPVQHPDVRQPHPAPYRRGRAQGARDRRRDRLLP